MFVEHKTHRYGKTISTHFSHFLNRSIFVLLQFHCSTLKPLSRSYFNGFKVRPAHLSAGPRYCFVASARSGSYYALPLCATIIAPKNTEKKPNRNGNRYTYRYIYIYVERQADVALAKYLQIKRLQCDGSKLAKDGPGAGPGARTGLQVEGGPVQSGNWGNTLN